MNTKIVVSKTNNLCKHNYLRFYNIAHQYLNLEKQLAILDGYSRIKRSKNELEKSFNKL